MKLSFKKKLLAIYLYKRLTSALIGGWLRVGVNIQTSHAFSHTFASRGERIGPHLTTLCRVHAQHRLDHSAPGPDRSTSLPQPKTVPLAYHSQNRKTSMSCYPQVVTEVKFIINLVFGVETAVLLLPHVFPQHLVCLEYFLAAQAL